MAKLKVPRPKPSGAPNASGDERGGGSDEVQRASATRDVFDADGPTLEPGHVIDGKYELERPLAKGGMGAVWVARHLKLNEPVAIKFMRADLAASRESFMRFEREATAVAQLQRKTMHVVHIHDYGIDDGSPYIVMELLEGETLHGRLKRCKRLGLHEVAGIVEQLCSALRAAHEAGIIHRDIKPGNIFVNRKGDQEVLKVIDFGLAKGETLDVIGESTKSGGVLGSPHYMSPEQATGNGVVDARADLWAIGVVAYRAVVGKLPFPGTKLGDILVRVARDAAPTPSTVRPELGTSLDAFFERALAKAPEDRFASADELSAAFASAVGLTPHVSGGFRPMSHSMASIVVTEAPPSGPGVSSPPRVVGSATPAATDAPGDPPTVPHDEGSMGGSLGGTSIPRIGRPQKAAALAAGGVVLLLFMLVVLLSGEDLETPASSLGRRVGEVSVEARETAAEQMASRPAPAPAQSSDPPAASQAPPAASQEPPATSASPTTTAAPGPLPSKAAPAPRRAKDCPPGGFHPQWGYPCPAR
jgi:eukaryotic-like serine/threonine-protein kinase